MFGRLFTLVLLAFMGIVAVSAASGAMSYKLSGTKTAAAARRSHDVEMERQRLAAIEADRRMRYDSGQMVGEERRLYEEELERRAAAERRRAAAAAAAAARRSVRGSNRTGGGFSSGK